MENTFKNDNEHWCVYEFIDDKSDMFHYSIWRPGYIESNDTLWSEDTPENPHSVLAFIRYSEWAGEEPCDLRGKTITVSLRGKDLNLKGANIYFWVMSGGARFHRISPLSIGKNWTKTTI